MKPNRKERRAGLVTPVEPGRILQGMRDKAGKHTICYGTSSVHLWIDLQRFAINESFYFALLASLGFRFLSSAKKAAFREELEDFEDFVTGVLAPQPGWVEDHYVRPDGKVLSRKGSTEQVVVAFTSTQKFTPVGELSDWQEELEPVVQGQALPFFVLCYAFVGPLLKFAPSGTLNPQIELVGPAECGKTTLARLAASTAAGDPKSEVGGGETWAMTLASFDKLREGYSDGLLCLDDQNLAGSSPREQSEMLRRFVFKASSAAGKKRYTDTATPPNVSLAVLSTANVPLREHVTAPEVAVALQTRMATILISPDRRFGIFDSVPDDFRSARAAIEHMKSACDAFYGSAAREFVKRLVNSDPRKVRAAVRRAIRKSNRWLDEMYPKRSGRISDTFGLTTAAAFFARRWGILPASFGDIRETMLAVYAMTQDPKIVASPYPYNVLQAYVDRIRGSIVHIDKLETPMTSAEFNATPCFVGEKWGRKAFMIPAVVFQSEFPDYRRLMRKFLELGDARSEPNKLTIKTPKAICETGRVYVVFARRDK